MKVPCASLAGPGLPPTGPVVADSVASPPQSHPLACGPVPFHASIPAPWVRKPGTHPFLHMQPCEVPSAAGPLRDVVWAWL